MTPYKLVWTSQYGKETIEEDIETRKEAQFLQREYTIAFNEGSIAIVKQYRARKEKE